ncbi:hypothetical protein [Blastococcus saxobsidens]|uniref:Uncharacterized protein n=1 Tax=Blastococcus saxobsidens (strain DD2) TaxID=1146883 RepID=H6RMN7_BLASD|nr:hypothetical protein [Blastococcus saxobsidens]CCG03872.1 protein of unknown function [Blastococcus saxobsidens DD2]
MEFFAAAEQETYWLVQPLMEVGLPLDEIRDLLCRLGFEAVVCDSRSIDARVSSLVGDRPDGVRAAWVETVSRMIAVPQADAGARPVRPAPPG